MELPLGNLQIDSKTWDYSQRDLAVVRSLKGILLKKWSFCQVDKYIPGHTKKDCEMAYFIIQPIFK